MKNYLSVPLPPSPGPKGGGGRTRLRVRGLWGGGSQFGRLEKKPSTLYGPCGVIESRPGRNVSDSMNLNFSNR